MVLEEHLHRKNTVGRGELPLYKLNQPGKVWNKFRRILNKINKTMKRILVSVNTNQVLIISWCPYEKRSSVSKLRRAPLIETRFFPAGSNRWLDTISSLIVSFICGQKKTTRILVGVHSTYTAQATKIITSRLRNHRTEANDSKSITN